MAKHLTPKEALFQRTGTTEDAWYFGYNPIEKATGLNTWHVRKVVKVLGIKIPNTAGGPTDYTWAVRKTELAAYLQTCYRCGSRAAILVGEHALCRPCREAVRALLLPTFQIPADVRQAIEAEEASTHQEGADRAG